MHWRSQKGRAKFGKVEIQFSRKKLNFNFLRTDFGYLSTAQAVLALHIACSVLFACTLILYTDVTVQGRGKILRPMLEKLEFTFFEFRPCYLHELHAVKRKSDFLESSQSPYHFSGLFLQARSLCFSIFEGLYINPYLCPVFCTQRQ